MRTVTYAALAVANAIVTSLASTTGIQTLTGAGLTGAIGAARMPLPRTLTVTLSTHAAAYVAASTVVITGLDCDGLIISETFTIVGTGGGVTIVGTEAFIKVTSVVIAAQATALGAFTVGVRDVVCNPLTLPEGFRVGGAGNLKLGYPDGTTDTLTSLAVNTTIPCNPSIVYGDTDTTATLITLFVE